MLNNPIKILFLNLLIVSVGCSNDDNTPATPASGSISGEVMLYDEGTVNLGGEGMTIIVQDSDPQIMATTNSLGQFTLENVPFGTHTLSYEKEGYGTFKRFEVELTADNSPLSLEDTPSLGQLSTTAVVEITAEVEGDEVTLFVGTDPAGNVGNIRYVRFFLRDRENVSDERYGYFSETIAAGNNPVEFNLTRSQLESLGFAQGSEVYVIAYGDSFWSNDYLDPNESIFVFPNLNPSTVAPITFEVP